MEELRNWKLEELVKELRFGLEVSTEAIISELESRVAGGDVVGKIVGDICTLCETVDYRASATDGPIPRTLDAMTKDERYTLGECLGKLYAARNGGGR